jgi:hypothetical protein
MVMTLNEPIVPLVDKLWFCGEVIVYIGQDMHAPPDLKYGQKVTFHQQWMALRSGLGTNKIGRYQIRKEFPDGRFELLDELFEPRLFISLSEWRSKKIDLLLDNDDR